MSATTSDLERRRRLTLRWALLLLVFPTVAWPLAARFGEGGETRESVAGAVMLAGLVALLVVPVILGLWRRYMARTLLDALVAGRSDIRHIDGAQGHAAQVALQGPACDLGAFGPAALVEPFAKATVDHVITG